MVMQKNGKRIIINEGIKDYYISKGWEPVKEETQKTKKGKKNDLG